MQQEKITKSKNWKILWLILGAIIVVWSVAWFVLSSKIAERYDFTQGKTYDNVLVKCEEQTNGGFPFRFVIYCKDFSIGNVNNSDEKLIAENVKLSAMVYRPNHIVAHVDSPLVYLDEEYKTPTLFKLNFDRLIASAIIKDESIQNFAIETDEAIAEFFEGNIVQSNLNQNNLSFKKVSVYGNFDNDTFGLKIDDMLSNSVNLPLNLALKGGISENITNSDVADNNSSNVNSALEIGGRLAIADNRFVFNHSSSYNEATNEFGNGLLKIGFVENDPNEPKQKENYGPEEQQILSLLSSVVSGMSIFAKSEQIDGLNARVIDIKFEGDKIITPFGEFSQKALLNSQLAPPAP